jgi:hypothetical protein
MCDYSLHGIPNRLAVEGERLAVHQFPTGSKGLASLADVRTSAASSPLFASGQFWSRLKSWFSAPPKKKAVAAVCVPPGARLRLRDIPLRLQTQLGVTADEEVTFIQLSAEAFQYRDAVRFSNNRAVLLQRLEVGQRAEVLCLKLAEEVQQPPMEVAARR